MAKFLSQLSWFWPTTLFKHFAVRLYDCWTWCRIFCAYVCHIYEYFVEFLSLLYCKFTCIGFQQ